MKLVEKDGRLFTDKGESIENANLTSIVRLKNRTVCLAHIDIREADTAKNDNKKKGEKKDEA